MEKDSAVAHFALEGLPNKVMAAEYRTVLPKEPILVAEIEKTIHAIETRRSRQRTAVAQSDQPRSGAEADAFRSRMSRAVDRGLAIGTRRTRIAIKPFRALVASVTMLPPQTGRRAPPRCGASIRTRRQSAALRVFSVDDAG